jgi:hypothetical protein
MTDETMTNGGALPVPAEPRAIAAQQDFRAGTAALAEMPQAEFDARLLSMARGRDRLKQIHQELMAPETDYGMIPGTAKPTLLKPGAEKLLHFYRLCSEFLPVITYGDGETTPWITVVTECRLHLGELDGPVVNTGHGAANSWEKRYRRAGSENTAAFDMLNTLVKMSIKRAMVDATLRATATSGVYSQDMEDLQQAVPPVAQRPGERPAARSAPEPPPAEPEIVICCVDDCGAVLNADELKASVKHFGGVPYCTHHGREALDAKRAAQSEPAPASA